jgi:hypothetical protein
MTSTPPALLEFLDRYDPGVQAVALGLRRLVLEEMAPQHEYIFAMRSAVVLLYGPTDRVIEDCVCMISVYRKHANLRFTDGVDLEDPQGLLQGTGKRMRYLSVRSASELNRPELREFLQKARKHAGLTRRKAGDVITRVKNTPPRKRPASDRT